MPYPRYEKLFGGFPKRNEEISTEKQAVFNKHCGGFGCGGCFITAITEFIKDPLNSILNQKFTFSVRQGIYSYLTDGYDLNNPEEKLLCIKDAVNYYMKRMYLEGEALDDIIRCRGDVALEVQNVKWKKEMEEHDKELELDYQEMLNMYYESKAKHRLSH